MSDWYDDCAQRVNRSTNGCEISNQFTHRLLISQNADFRNILNNNAQKTMLASSIFQSKPAVK